MSPRGGSRAASGLAVAAAALAALAVAAPGVVFRGETFFWRDHVMYAHPLLARIDGEVRRGAAPAWDPALFCGTPAVAEGLSAADPRLRLWFAGAAALGIPFERSYPWLFFAHGVAGALGAALLARTVGASRAAAAAAGLAYALAGALVPATDSVLLLFSAAWAPLVAAAMVRAVARAGAAPAPSAAAAMEEAPALPGAAWVALGAVAVAFALRGDPQIAVASVLAGGVLALAQVGVSARTLALAGLTPIAGALLAAPHLLPLRAAAAGSERARAIPYDVAAAHSLRPERLIEIAAPLPFGTVHPLRYDARALDPGEQHPIVPSAYTGASALVLAAIGTGTAAATRPRRRLAAALAALAALGVVLALGRHAPLHRLVHEHLLLFDRFRFPEKWIVLAHLALAPLGALGIDRIAGARAPRWVGGMGVALALTGGALSLAAALDIAAFPLDGPGARAVSHALAAAGAVALAAALRGGRRGAPALLAVVLGADLAIAAQPLSPTAPPSIREESFAARAIHEAEQARAARRSPGDGPARLLFTGPTVPRGAEATFLLDRGLSLDAAPQRFAIDALWGSVAVENGLEAFGGNSTLPPTRPRALEREALRGDPDLTTRVAILGGCRYAIAPAGSALAADPRWRVLAERPIEGIAVLALREEAPRARVVGAAHFFPDAAAARAAALDPALDPAGEVAIEGAPGEAAMPDVAPGPAGTVTALRIGDDEVAIALEATRDGWLVLADAYAPGWSATVNGAPARIRAANGAFRAIAVGRGQQDVRLRYEEPNAAAGKALAIAAAAGLGGAVLYCAAPWRRFRR